MAINKITKKQLKKMARIFRRSGRTFQEAAEEAGLVNIPDNAGELTQEEGRQFLKYFGAYLITPKEKQ